MVHELKTHPPFYQRVLDGSKTCEVRLNDRDFQAGDRLQLREWDPEAPTEGIVRGAYTGRHENFEVTHVFHLSSFWDPEDPDIVAMSIRLWTRQV